MILRINDQPTTSGRQAMNQVARAKPGDSIELEVLRSGQPVNLKAEVAVRPSFQN